MKQSELDKIFAATIAAMVELELEQAANAPLLVTFESEQEAQGCDMPGRGSRARRTERRRQERIARGEEHESTGDSRIRTYKKRSAEPSGDNAPPQQGTPGGSLRDASGSAGETPPVPGDAQTGT